MFCRIILINTTAVSLGLIAGLTLLNTGSAQVLAGESTKENAPPVAYDIYNVDYEFPQADSEQFKDNKILKYKAQSMDMTAFQVPSRLIEEDDIDAELESYYRQDDAQKQAEAAHYRALERNRMAAYQAYLHKKAKMQAQIDQELGPVLEELTISAEDAQLASLDE